MEISITQTKRGELRIVVQGPAEFVGEVLGRMAEGFAPEPVVMSDLELDDLFADAAARPSPLMSSLDDVDDVDEEPENVPAPRFNVGDHAEVASKAHWHPYAIGTVVEIREPLDSDGDYYVRAVGDTDQWFVAEEDLAPVTLAPSFVMTEDEARAFLPIFGDTSAVQDRARGIHGGAAFSLYRRIRKTRDEFPLAFPLALSETEAKIVMAFLCDRNAAEDPECLWVMFDRFADSLPAGFLAFLDEVDDAKSGTCPLIGSNAE